MTPSNWTDVHALIESCEPATCNFNMETYVSDMACIRAGFERRKAHPDDSLTVGTSSQHPVRTGLNVGANEAGSVPRSGLSTSGGSVLFP